MDKRIPSLKKTLRSCKNGHRYYKSSDCPTCPPCEEAKKPKDDFLSLFYAPARRALGNAGIKTVEQLSAWSERDLLKFHGLGKSAIPVLKREPRESRANFERVMGREFNFVQ